MPVVPISVPSLLGGVSRAAQSQRLASQVEEADNVVISISRGIEKRAATLLVGEAALAATAPTSELHVGWMDRDADERFVYLINPTISTLTLATLTTGPTVGNRILQAVTGAEGIVVGSNTTDNEIYFIPVGSTGTFNATNTITELDAGPGTTLDPSPATPSGVDIQVDATAMIEVFDVADGSAVAVDTSDVDQAGVQVTDAWYAYIAFSFEELGADPRRRLRSLTIADTTLITNKLKPTALRGGPLTYRNTAGTEDIRNDASAQNVESWADFDHPPTSPADGVTIPAGELGDSNVNVDDDDVWYAREDDVGQPQGFYAAISATQPPWFERIRTEGAGSVIDERTFPVRLDFDGTTFTPALSTWTDRLSGDSATNPGPGFLGSAVTDVAFHQGRLFFSSAERIGSSQAGDTANLWLESEILEVDSDPINERLTNNRVSNIDALTQFREALILTTSGAKQFELRSDGPLSPNTARLEQSTSIKNVPYVHPVTLGDQMYFMAERNFAMVLYEYLFDPDSVSNIATDVTADVEEYVPAQASLMVPSEAHDSILILTDAAPNEIYIYKAKWRDRETKVMSTWYRWVTDEGNEILSMSVFDEDLYLLIRRNDLLWLERVAVERPEDDTVGAAPNLEDLGYQVRLDSRLSLQGVYSETENETTWTVPFEDAGYTEIVLGPGWDADSGGDEQRLAGTRLFPTVTVGTGETTLVVPGQYENNIAGDPEIAYAGRPYTMTITLSEQFARGEQGVPAKGITKLMKLTARHKDTGYYYVSITAQNRDEIRKEFIFQRTGSTFLDGEFVEPDGEFQCRTMGEAHSTTISIINDSPLPSNIVDLEFRARFVPKQDASR